MADKRIIPPEEVTSPRRTWTLFKVLENREGASVALGKWKGEANLGIRWNGTDANPIGSPQSRGLPTWFMVPERFRQGIISALGESEQRAAEFFLRFTLDDVPQSGRKRKRRT